MSIDVYGPGCAPQVIAEQGECGNLWAVRQAAELTALAQNKTIAIAKLAPYHDLIRLDYRCDALGADTGISFGWEAIDGSSGGTLVAVADTSSATSGSAVLFPTDTLSCGIYITAKQTGSGAASGTVQIYAHEIYRGA